MAEIASEKILKGKERLAALDARLRELVEANPRGEVIRSLLGMGTTLTAEFLAEVGDVERFGSADDLAAAAGCYATGSSTRSRLPGLREGDLTTTSGCVW